MPRPYIYDYDAGDDVIAGFIVFGGKQVNLNRLATSEKLDYSYIWRVFNSNRTPSISYAMKLAQCLHMSLDAFLKELAARKNSAA